MISLTPLLSLLRRRYSIRLLALTVMSNLAVAQTPEPQVKRSGEQVYRAVCTACHETGVAHAPRLGDREAWATLIAEGQHILTAHAWVGVRAMPPRGGSNEISLTEFASAVAYMARHAGGDWNDPDRKQLLKIAREADKRLNLSISEKRAMQRELRQFLKNPR